MRSNVRRRIYALPLPLLTGPPCVINTQNRHQALILNLILIHLHQWLDTSGYKICNLRDILIDLKHRRNRCKVCHQRKYFDQGGLSREREFGPGAFCPRRKCGAERDFKQGTQSGSHVFSERLICVFSEGSSLTIALLLNSLGATGRVPGCHGISSSLQVSVDVTLKISREYRRKYPENIVENIRLSVSDLLGRGTDLLSGRRCARDYRGGLTWTAVRQVPLVEEPPRSRLCLLLPAKRFCVTRHGKIFRIFTDIFRGFHTWACRNFPGGRNFLDEDDRKCLRYSN